MAEMRSRACLSAASDDAFPVASRSFIFTRPDMFARALRSCTCSSTTSSSIIEQLCLYISRGVGRPSHSQVSSSMLMRMFAQALVRLKMHDGVVVERQDSTRIINSGGELCGNGSAMNYCIDSVSVDARARRNNVNVGVYTQSLRSGYFRPRTGLPLILDTHESADNVDCYILVSKFFPD